MTDVEAVNENASEPPGGPAARRDGRAGSNLPGVVALGLLGVTVVALTVLLSAPPEAASQPLEGTPAPAATPFYARFNPRGVAEGGQLFQREPVAHTTLVPTLTPYVTPTLAPVTPIPWNTEDTNALTWLCYEEVRGMNEARYDACLSVISTVRRRYAYADDPYWEDTIEETLRRENQFPIDFELDRPAPDAFLQDAVEQYRWGARGSCTGYLYYDSVPGGPSLCVIRAANGSFVEFHNGWR